MCESQDRFARGLFQGNHQSSLLGTGGGLVSTLSYLPGGTAVSWTTPTESPRGPIGRAAESPGGPGRRYPESPGHHSPPRRLARVVPPQGSPGAAGCPGRRPSGPVAESLSGRVGGSRGRRLPSRGPSGTPRLPRPPFRRGGWGAASPRRCVLGRRITASPRHRFARVMRPCHVGRVSESLHPPGRRGCRVAGCPNATEWSRHRSAIGRWPSNWGSPKSGVVNRPAAAPQHGATVPARRRVRAMARVPGVAGLLGCRVAAWQGRRVNEWQVAVSCGRVTEPLKSPKGGVVNRPAAAPQHGASVPARGRVRLVASRRAALPGVHWSG